MLRAKKRIASWLSPRADAKEGSLSTARAVARGGRREGETGKELSILGKSLLPWGEYLKSSPADSQLLSVEILNQSISKIWVQNLEQALPTREGAQIKASFQTHAQRTPA